MDDGDGSGIRLAVIVVCLLISFFSSGAETAFFSMSAVRVRQLQEAKRKYIEIIIELKNRPDLLLGTVLLTNTIVNIIATSSVSGLFPAGELGQVIASVVATLLLLIFGEITPKSIAAHDPEQFAFGTAVLLCGTVRLLSPLVWLMNRLNPAAGKKQAEISADQARERILVAAGIGEQSGELAAEERQIIKQILTVDRQPASQFMHPIAEAVSLNPDITLKEAVHLSQLSGYSRFPVLEVGRPIGLLLIQDLLLPLHQGQANRNIRSFLRPIARYPEDKAVGLLLQEMRQNREQLVLIADTQGRLSGFLSIEDLIEQFIGEISDEYDDASPVDEGGEVR